MKYQKITKFFLVLLIGLFIASPVLAIGLGDSATKLDTVAGGNGAGYDTSQKTPDNIISTIIRTLLSLLGVLFLVLLIYGGYIWLMARGDSGEVDKAKDIIRNAIIGLIIVLAAYAISAFVFSALESTTLQTT